MAILKNEITEKHSEKRKKTTYENHKTILNTET